MLAVLLTTGLGMSGSGFAQTNAPKPASTHMSKDTYTMALKSDDDQYKADKDACGSMSGNAKDICQAEAKGKEKVAKAEAEAAYKNTPNARQEARVAQAQAQYDVAKEKCDDLAGNKKDVCVKEAKADLVKGKADAKVDRVVSDTRKTAVSKQTEARTEANEDKREADYKVAIEKCDALAGATKDTCIGSAKVQFGKS
jgi:hypothetical protein